MVLNDNKSKFGTLVYAQWDQLLNYKLNDSKRILYQVGRVLIYITLKEKHKNQLYSSFHHHSYNIARNHATSIPPVFKYYPSQNYPSTN